MRAQDKRLQLRKRRKVFSGLGIKMEIMCAFVFILPSGQHTWVLLSHPFYPHTNTERARDWSHGP